MAFAASSSVAKPSDPDCMNDLIRSIPTALVFGVMSTRTNPHDTVRSLVPSASMADMPPSDAPINTGGRPNWSATATQSAQKAVNE